MKEIHILFTGVGRRIELLQAFRQAALELNITLKLYGADTTDLAPALAYCDFSRIICAMKDSQYIEQLINICMQDKIDLVIPTIDTDLLVLSQNVIQFGKIGTRVLVSTPDKIQICRDKNNTGTFFEKCGLKAPKTVNNYKEFDGEFPCFIKPKDGSSSINAFKVEDEQELAFYANRIQDYIIQPFVRGREFTVDIFCDFVGNPIFITPRERLQVRAGEVLKTKICLDQTIINQAKSICSQFKPCGPLTVQLIQESETGENWYIEINPRFGGGSPLSMKAGANSAWALLKLLRGDKLVYNTKSCQNEVVYSRFDQSVCVSGTNDLQIMGVIFDLDDTLYSEKQYVRSGYKAVAEFLGKPDAEDQLWTHFVAGDLAIDKYLSETGLLDRKEECLNVYRNHIPDITLSAGVLELISELKKQGLKVGIITDGRPEGQRNKIKALGLEEVIEDIIITDELGGVQFRKPCDISYRIMQNRWRIPFEQIVYVGDNPNKDFHACRELGMKWIWFKNGEGLYGRDSSLDVWISSIEEIGDIIINSQFEWNGR